MLTVTGHAETKHAVNRCSEHCQTDKLKSMSCVRACNYGNSEKKGKRIKAFTTDKYLIDFQNKTFKKKEDKGKWVTVKLTLFLLPG